MPGEPLRLAKVQLGAIHLLVSALIGTVKKLRNDVASSEPPVSAIYSFVETALKKV